MHVALCPDREPRSSVPWTAKPTVILGALLLAPAVVHHPVVLEKAEARSESDGLLVVPRFAGPRPRAERVLTPAH